MVVSVDSVVEGIHFDLALCSPADVGWKALMSALSDVAAMGADAARARWWPCARPGWAGRGGRVLEVMEGVAGGRRGERAARWWAGTSRPAGQLVVVVTVWGSLDGARR